MAVGNARLIDALRRIKSNLDSGVCQAVQRAAITALEGPDDCIREHNEIYQRRRDLVVATLKRIGLKCRPPRASVYVWARVPDGYTAAALATELLDEVGVVVTPGTGYGSAGEGIVRLSLTISDDDLAEGLKRLSAWRGG